MFERTSPWLLAVLLCCAGGSAAGQSSVMETNAPSVKWYQLNTPNFRVLYPQGFETQAQRVVNTLETIRDPEARTMGTAPKKISVILQNQSSLSNGFVTMAPRRSEFYTMPTQNYNFLGTNDWLDALSVHEYRHMAQFQRSITGFNKLLFYVFGQQVTAGMAFAAAPMWFWEGDAVATETAFTGSGRGRIPQFDMLFRTNAMEGRTFNYHKQYLRSYKHNMPDHYVLGYNMITHLRKKTGDPMIWEKVVGRSWNVPFLPFAFSNALKRESGMYVTGLYDDLAQQRKKDYEQAVAGLTFTAFERINPRVHTAFTDYQFPQPLPDGRILAVKSGIGDIDQLVALSPDGTEKRIFTQGIVNESAMLSSEKNRVVWNEFRYDPRWRVKNYGVVMGYDIGAGRAAPITRQSRYSGAAIAPEGIRVATVESRENYSIRLVVLNYANGEVFKTFENPHNDMLAMPRWTEDGKSIVLLRTNGEGKTISRVDFATGEVTDLLPRSLENIGHPVPWGPFVLFNSPTGGIDNLHAVNVLTGKRYQITTSRYGAFNPAVSPDGKWLYYNDQTRDGLDVVRMPMDTLSWEPFTGEVPSANFNYAHLVEQEAHPTVLKEVPTTTYSPKRYRKAAGMINPHSWGPYFTGTLTRLNIGIASQDILSTTSIFAGYEYDLQEETGQWKAGISYQGFYPILDLQVIRADRKINEGLVGTEVITGTDTAVQVQELRFTWKETAVEGGFRIPLLTTSSRFLGSVQFANYVGYTRVTDFNNTISGDSRVVNRRVVNGDVTSVYTFFNYPANGNLYYNHFSIEAYRLLKRSRRDINSKWGQFLLVNLYSTPYGGDYTGYQFSAYGTAYFPGLFKHHSIWGHLAYQKSDVQQLFYTDTTRSEVADNMSYQFRNQIPLPRGQSVSRFINMYSASVNYTLPLWYPDIAIGPLLNFQRFRGNVFFDYARGESTFTGGTVSQVYASIGGELRLDFNVMRFLPQFNVGLRYSYGLSPSTTKTNLFEVFIGGFSF